jgi:hypothetical protein
MGNLPPDKVQAFSGIAFDAEHRLMLPGDRAYSEVPSEHFP